jgi:hypothetical protein
MLGGFWRTGAPNKRVAFAIVAMIASAIFMAVKLRSPHGTNWVFIALAPFYLVFFALQIRRALQEKRVGQD